MSELERESRSDAHHLNEFVTFTHRSDTRGRLRRTNVQRRREQQYARTRRPVEGHSVWSGWSSESVSHGLFSAPGGGESSARRRGAVGLPFSLISCRLNDDGRYANGHISGEVYRFGGTPFRETIVTKHL